MNIVFIIDQVYLHGGIERVLSIKANYFAADKTNKVNIITSEQKGKKPCYYFDEAINFKDLNINYDRKISYFNPLNVLKIPKHIYRLRKYLKELKPDIVVVCSHSVDTYFVPFLLKGTPKIKEYHFSKSIEIPYRTKGNKSKKRYFLKFADYIDKKYDKIIVLNKDEATYYKSNNTIVIPNPNTFFPDTISNHSSKIAIAAGRIAPVKQFDQLIEIWNLVAKEKKEWQLHIYGTGDKGLLDNLQYKISNYKLDNNIILKGATNKIKDKMLNASMFLMTSKNECFPLVLLEAQACGLPIISYNCPHGPQNIINDKNGILILQEHITDFSKSIINLIDKPDLRKTLGKAARLNALNYSEDKIMHKWKSVFNQLTNI
ncbi:glycosyltransferase family 4 protein [Seonamhaeicola algicola]|uniref:Glycosyltransferase family 4 protein n=1 Tax=Seonamhaeicola algicola TaxID=1719036 RepID=A0A5C7B1A2_9FLAO|nr:glycosyltransferase family 4 protein [Seonamhaeicola algicola]TXE11662.1 glycosyltransferase family 4 protein [Seonamhaeicola algicola]